MVRKCVCVSVPRFLPPRERNPPSISLVATFSSAWRPDTKYKCRIMLQFVCMCTKHITVSYYAAGYIIHPYPYLLCSTCCLALHTYLKYYHCFLYSYLHIPIIMYMCTYICVRSRSCNCTLTETHTVRLLALIFLFLIVRLCVSVSHWSLVAGHGIMRVIDSFTRGQWYHLLFRSTSTWLRS